MTLKECKIEYRCFVQIINLSCYKFLTNEFFDGRRVNKTKDAEINSTTWAEETKQSHLFHYHQAGFHKL